MTERISPVDTVLDRQALEQVLREANMPTLPVVAQKLVELCRNENANFNDFARVLSADSGLTSRILRVANSAYFGLRIKATSLARAITALGLEYVKSISLGFYLAGSLNKLGSSGFDMGDYWCTSVLRAVIARQLASRYVPDKREEAFLVGLLQDSGVPFMAQVLGPSYAAIWQQCCTSPSSLRKLEQELFGFDHVKAVAIILEQWAFPEILAEPINQHHRCCTNEPSSDEQVQLCQIGYFVGTLPLNDPESLSAEDLSLCDYCRSVFGLTQDDMSAVLEQSQQEFFSVSQLFSDILPEQVDVTSLLSQANTLLSGLATQANRKSFDLEVEVKRLRIICGAMSSSLEESVMQAETDSLTGLFQRGRLQRYVEVGCDVVQSGEGTLTLMFIDIDDFKMVNSRYGHSVGNAVLQELANILKKLFGGNACVARYGGDELVVALLGLNLKQAVTLATELSRRIRQVRIPDCVDVHESRIVQAKGDNNRTDHFDEMAFSCSIGMLFCESGSQPGSALAALDLADSQMYQVKKGGKGSFCYQVLPAQASRQVPGSAGVARDETSFGQ